MSTFVSDLSKKEFPLQDRVKGRELQPALREFLARTHPNFGDDSAMGLPELNALRREYVTAFLEREVTDLDTLQARVREALYSDDLLTPELENDTLDARTLGQRVADKVASFGGSWTFLISFFIFLAVWIAANVVLYTVQLAFDPFPFILLNLILSCLASVQAPIIMMSQNRQEEKDRDRARKDYMINLKSELEIRVLHEKIDHLILHQQRQLMEIQKMQVDMMNEILAKIEDRENPDSREA